jgi:hypothetical protein
VEGVFYVKYPKRGQYMKSYFLTYHINIFFDDNELHWATVADVDKTDNPSLGAQEDEPFVLVKSGPAIIKHDTLILLWPNEQEYVSGDTTGYNLNMREAPRWTHTKYFLDFMESTPSILQECATRQFVMPEDDGVQEVIDNLKPVLLLLIKMHNNGLPIFGSGMPAE